MPDFIFNRSKGRFVEFAERVNGNDPSASGLVLAMINTTATDATLKDLDTMAQIESDANTAELTSGTNANYARKVLTDAGAVITVTYDDTNDRVDVDVPDQTWTALGAGTAITDLVFLYDNDTGTVSESSLVPISQHDFALTPDGSDITATIAVFARAN